MTDIDPGAVYALQLNTNGIWFTQIGYTWTGNGDGLLEAHRKLEASSYAGRGRVVLLRPAEVIEARDRPIDWSRRHHGICPKCGEDKFIGHGPLCTDCYLNGDAT